MVMRRVAAIINAIMTALAFGFLLKAEPSFAANNEEQTEYKLSRSEITLELGGTGYDIKITPKPTTQPKYDYSNSKEYLSIDSAGHITAIRPTDELQEIKIVIGSDTLTFLVKKINDAPNITKIIRIIDKEHKKNATLFIIIIVSLGVLLVISIIVLICLYSNNKKKGLLIYNLKDTIRRSKEEDDYNGKNLRIKNLERENQKLKNRVGELEDLYNKMQQNVKETHENTETKTEHSTNGASSNIKDDENTPKQRQTTRLYSDAIIDGYFNKVTEKATDDTIFELHVEKNGANISVYSDAIRRIIANPSFLDGCDKQIIGNRIVEIKEQGFAQRQMDGKWKVNKKLNVLIK